jgi:2-oxoglutarate ferredoxin oxidoreductase subunit gamma
MKESVNMAGFGGQGVLLIGQILTQLTMDKGLEVTWIPSYGAEMRGGTANCMVVYSDLPIGSPLVRHPNSLIAMNPPSLQRFHHRVKEGGLVIYNASLIDPPEHRAGLAYLGVDSVAEAQAAGDHRIANMVLLGAYLERRGLWDDGLVRHAVEQTLGSRRSHFLEMNLLALARGRDVSLAP